jgi:WhiB family transcriptional regulator, redox-sensing transcriptional regulator
MTAGWWHDAACKGMDVSLFFPANNCGQGFRTAMALCASCPVRVECLDDAIATETTHGIRGGFTASERKHIKPATGTTAKGRVTVNAAS